MHPTVVLPHGERARCHCHLPSCGTVRYRGLPRAENRSTEASDRDAAGSEREECVRGAQRLLCPSQRDGSGGRH